MLKFISALIFGLSFDVFASDLSQSCEDNLKKPKLKLAQKPQRPDSKISLTEAADRFLQLSPEELTRDVIEDHFKALNLAIVSNNFEVGAVLPVLRTIGQVGEKAEAKKDNVILLSKLKKSNSSSQKAFIRSLVEILSGQIADRRGAKFDFSKWSFVEMFELPSHLVNIGFYSDTNSKILFIESVLAKWNEDIDRRIQKRTEPEFFGLKWETVSGVVKFFGFLKAEAKWSVQNFITEAYFSLESDTTNKIQLANKFLKHHLRSSTSVPTPAINVLRESLKTLKEQKDYKREDTLATVLGYFNFSFFGERNFIDLVDLSFFQELTEWDQFELSIGRPLLKLASWAEYSRFKFENNSELRRYHAKFDKFAKIMQILAAKVEPQIRKENAHNSGPTRLKQNVGEKIKMFFDTNFEGFEVETAHFDEELRKWFAAKLRFEGQEYAIMFVDRSDGFQRYPYIGKKLEANRYTHRDHLIISKKYPERFTVLQYSDAFDSKLYHSSFGSIAARLSSSLVNFWELDVKPFEDARIRHRWAHHLAKKLDERSPYDTPIEEVIHFIQDLNVCLEWGQFNPSRIEKVLRNFAVFLFKKNVLHTDLQKHMGLHRLLFILNERLINIMGSNQSPNRYGETFDINLLPVQDLVALPLNFDNIGTSLFVKIKESWFREFLPVWSNRIRTLVANGEDSNRSIGRVFALKALRFFWFNRLNPDPLVAEVLALAVLNNVNTMDLSHKTEISLTRETLFYLSGFNRQIPDSIVDAVNDNLITELTKPKSRWDGDSVSSIAMLLSYIDLDKYFNLIHPVVLSNLQELEINDSNKRALRNFAILLSANRDKNLQRYKNRITPEHYDQYIRSLNWVFTDYTPQKADLEFDKNGFNMRVLGVIQDYMKKNYPGAKIDGPYFDSKSKHLITAKVKIGIRDYFLVSLPLKKLIRSNPENLSDFQPSLVTEREIKLHESMHPGKVGLIVYSDTLTEGGWEATTEGIENALDRLFVDKWNEE